MNENKKVNIGWVKELRHDIIKEATIKLFEFYFVLRTQRASLVNMEKKFLLRTWFTQ